MVVALVPVLNEQQRISSVIKNLESYVDQIVVIDDGSSDNTAQKAQDAGAVVLRHKINRGQGAALQTGHEYALKIGADFVVHFDGDGQFDANEIPDALLYMKKKKVDVLFGSRFLGKKANIPFTKKYLIMPLGRVLDRWVNGLNLTDGHNGFRILSKKALSEIVITQDRMAHATEIPRLVGKAKLKYIEFPVTVTYNEYGQGMRSGFRILYDLLVGIFVKK